MGFAPSCAARHAPLMTIAVIPALVCLAGLLMFALGGPKASAIGKDMFWVALLVLLLGSAGHAVMIGR